MGDAYCTFMSSEAEGEWIEVLEGLPYQEWMAQVLNYQKLDEHRWKKMLRLIAQLRPDAGWRFNTIQVLNEFGCLDEILGESLLESDNDSEIRELLKTALEVGR